MTLHSRLRFFFLWKCVPVQSSIWDLSGDRKTWKNNGLEKWGFRVLTPRGVFFSGVQWSFSQGKWPIHSSLTPKKASTDNQGLKKVISYLLETWSNRRSVRFHGNQKSIEMDPDRTDLRIRDLSKPGLRSNFIQGGGLQRKD